MRTKEQTERIVRPSAIAGSWYPGTERGLRQMLEGFFARVPEQRLQGRLLGLIAPHAGYIYSGQTAAYSYKLLEGRRYDIVVIMSPNHRAFWGADIVVSTATHYETPLGLVALDKAFIERLAERVELSGVQRDDEHSLEIQLPFLQYILGDFRLVPLMLNTDRPAVARQLGGLLAELIAASEAGVLLVASTDLHHIPNYEEVVRRDRAVAEALISYDMARIEKVLTEPGCSVCGRMPVIALLEAARALGADRVQVLHQTTSGDVTGDRRPGQYTVGYLAAAVVASV
ncbi:MAG: AmmeMemoRadiSam system protein B [Anaerolineae bacterium]|nr:AmmeMemoRadiSam system protein B [Anaerolineae bacterium]